MTDFNSKLREILNWLTVRAEHNGVVEAEQKITALFLSTAKEIIGGDVKQYCTKYSCVTEYIHGDECPVPYIAKLQAKQLNDFESAIKESLK